MTDEKPMFDKNRAQSWSQIWLFENRPEEWYQKYVLHKEQTTTKEMEFGKKIGERLASDPSFLPHVTRYKTFELPLRHTFVYKKEGVRIPFVGYVDTAWLEEFRIREYKTGKSPWTQSKVDSHGQIDAYLLLIYEIHKLRPEEMTVHLDWLPTVDVEVHHDSFASFLKGSNKVSIGLIDDTRVVTFQTKRTMADILRFRARILKNFLAMEEYCRNHA